MPVRTTRFAVSDMAVSGEPSVNDPPWNYRIVPGPPRLFGLDENPGTPTQSDRAGTHLLRDIASSLSARRTRPASPQSGADR